MKKTIAVVGATGSQGGGLCRALLKMPDTFEVRALTRNPESEKAKLLSATGAHVVQANLDDLASVTAAFEGADGVFGVTNYWEHQSLEREKAQAQNIAQACRDAGVKHVVWSTLEDTRTFIPSNFDAMPMLDDVYRVPHLDGKNEANVFFKELPATYLITSFFWDNLINFGMSPKRGEDGVYRWVMPFGDSLLAGHAAVDIGKAASQIFYQPERFIGKTVGIQADAITLEEMAQTVADVMEVSVEYVPIDADTFRSFPFDGAEEIGNNFQYFRDFNDDFVGLRSKQLMHDLNPSVISFREFVIHNQTAIRAVMDS